MAQPAIAETFDPNGQARHRRPVDLVHLAKQCMGDENLELEILRLYDTSLSTYFGRLQLSSAFDDLAINLHSIKGASAGVGAMGIAELARAMEAALRNGRPLRQEQIDDLGMAVEEVRGFIAELLSSKSD